MNAFNEDDEPLGARAAQKAATRDAVLTAAREEFERVGFEAANLRAIAERAGVSAGTVIHHYGDKRDLLHAALFEDLEKTLSRALARLGTPPLERQLEALTRAMFRYYEKRPQLSRTLLKESLFADPPWAERFTSQVGRVHATISRLALEARERRELREDADVALLSVAYFSFFYFGLIAWVQGAHKNPTALVGRLVEQHLAGLRPPHKPERKRA
jgi:AcrR family transcriptional regulator